MILRGAWLPLNTGNGASTGIPTRGAALETDAIRKDLRKVDKGLKVGTELSTSLLAVTQDEVFAGAISTAANPPRRAIQVHVIACFAPRSLPVVWNFSEILPATAEPEQVETRIKITLSLAQAKVRETLALNSSN